MVKTRPYKNVCTRVFRDIPKPVLVDDKELFVYFFVSYMIFILACLCTTAVKFIQNKGLPKETNNVKLSFDT